MQRKSYFVAVHVIGVGVILDVEAERLVSRHHGQRLVVDVAGDASFRHPGNEIVAFGNVLPE